MRLHQDVGNDDLVLQLRVLSFMTRVLMAADVIPGPAVEASILDVRDVLRRKIVADVVTFVDGTPRLARFGIDGNSDAIANAGGEDAASRAIGIELENVGAFGLRGIIVGVVDVGMRADGDVHLLAIEGESNIPCPVTSATKASPAGKIGDLLRGATRFEFSILIGKANDRVGVPNVDPLRIGSDGIDRDPKRLVETCGKSLSAIGLAVFGDAPEDHDNAGFAFRQKQVAVG